MIRYTYTGRRGIQGEEFTSLTDVMRAAWMFSCPQEPLVVVLWHGDSDDLVGERWHRHPWAVRWMGRARCLSEDGLPRPMLSYGPPEPDEEHRELAHDGLDCSDARLDLGSIVGNGRYSYAGQELDAMARAAVKGLGKYRGWELRLLGAQAQLVVYYMEKGREHEYAIAV